MEFRRIFDLLTLQNKQSPIFYYKEGLKWNAIDIEESIALCNRMSAGLLNLELEAGDRIAICAASGSPYWMLLVQAALQIELVVVPINSSASSDQILEVMRATQTKFAFVESRTDFIRFREIAEGMQHFNQVLAFYHLPDLESFEGLQTEPSAAHLETIQMFKAAIHEDDLAIILSQDDYLTYYSHKQILDQVQRLLPRFQSKTNQKALSFLPPGKLLEFVLLHTYLAAGLDLYFSNINQSLFTSLLEVKPDFIGLEATHVEDLRDYFYNQTTQETRISRKRTVWSIKIGEAFNETALNSLKYRLQYRLADWWRFRKWRKLLGGYLRGIIIDEPIKTSTVQLFKAAFIPVFYHNPESTSPTVASSEN
ncbi:MAG: hypothetical protein Sapg2KO_15920 [Saprospiraceae bacterium]